MEKQQVTIGDLVALAETKALNDLEKMEGQGKQITLLPHWPAIKSGFVMGFKNGVVMGFKMGEAVVKSEAENAKEDAAKPDPNQGELPL